MGTNLGIRSRLILIFLGLITVAVVGADVLLTRRIVPMLERDLESDVMRRLSLVRRIISSSRIGLDDIQRWDALADSLGAACQARITVIRRDGTVLGDSDVEFSRLPELENHAGRPEVAAALRGSEGTSTRWSVTVREQMLYLAEPFAREGKVVGVIRAAVSLAQMHRLTNRYRTLVLLASLTALAIAGVLSTLTSFWMSRSVRSLTATAQRMAEGDLSARTEGRGKDEVAQLGRALNQLGNNLGSTLDLLRAQRDLEDSILTEMKEGVILLGPDGRVALVNPALREMLLLRTDSLGRPLLEVIRNAEIHALVDQARTESRAESSEIEVTGLKPRRFLVHAAPLTGAPGGLLAVFVDVTELRRLEIVRRDFVANVSHELRTPVAAIRSAAETLRDGALTDPGAAGTFLGIIERNSERMGRLISDLLDLSRIEAQEFRFHIEALNLGAATEHALSVLLPAAAARKIRLLAEVPPGLPPAAADRRAFEQILTNLVDNAIKYSPEEASVTVTAEEAAGGRIRLAVRDNGPGIEARHLPRLFERFYRADTGRSRELGGTGLGLSIVKHLAEGLGGSVGVESRVGEGSEFWVLLLRSAPEATGPA